MHHRIDAGQEGIHCIMIGEVASHRFFTWRGRVEWRDIGHPQHPRQVFERAAQGAAEATGGTGQQ